MSDVPRMTAEPPAVAQSAGHGKAEQTAGAGPAEPTVNGRYSHSKPMEADSLSEAVIDLSAIGHNVRALRSRTGAQVMAVVKADAFGHGAVPVARAALAAGASWLGASSRSAPAGPSGVRPYT